MWKNDYVSLTHEMQESFKFESYTITFMFGKNIKYHISNFMDSMFQKETKFI